MATRDSLPADQEGIARPPTRWEKGSNVVFRAMTYAVAWLTVLLVLFIVFEIGWAAAPAIKRYGLGFLTGAKWDPNTEEYGIRPHIWGTLYSSVLAVIIGTVLGLSVAIFLSERFLSTFRLQDPEAVRRPSPSFLGQTARQPGTAAEEPDPALGGNPQRGLRIVGNLRHQSAGAADVQLAAQESGLGPVLRYLVQSLQHVARGAGAGDHGSADHLGD